MLVKNYGLLFELVFELGKFWFCWCVRGVCVELVVNCSWYDDVIDKGRWYDLKKKGWKENFFMRWEDSVRIVMMRWYISLLESYLVFKYIVFVCGDEEFFFIVWVEVWVF